MACELEIDNVARLARGINQRVEKMVEPSALAQMPYKVAAEGLERFSVWFARGGRRVYVCRAICMKEDIQSRKTRAKPRNELSDGVEEKGQG